MLQLFARPGRTQFPARIPGPCLSHILDVAPWKFSCSIIMPITSHEMMIQASIFGGNIGLPGLHSCQTLEDSWETPSYTELRLLPISKSQTFDHSSMVVANESSKPMIKHDNSWAVRARLKILYACPNAQKLVAFDESPTIVWVFYNLYLEWPGMTGCFCMFLLIQHGIVAMPSDSRASQPAAMNSTCTTFRPQQAAILDPNSPPAGGQTGTPALEQGHASRPGWIGTYPKHSGET